MGSRHDTVDREGSWGDEATSSYGSDTRGGNIPNSVFGVFFNSNPMETSQYKQPWRDEEKSDAKGKPTESYFTHNQYMNIFQSMGQSVHIMDRNYRIIFWNRGAEQIYGHTDSEALGRDVRELLVGEKDFQHATDIIDYTLAGDTWSGQFPVKSKKGENFVIVVTATPFYDDNGTLFAVIAVASDARKFEKSRSQPFPTQFVQDSSILSRPGYINPQHSMKVAISSKLSDLASKVKSKLGNGKNILELEGESRYSHYSNHMEDTTISSVLKGEIPSLVFGSFSHPGFEPHSPIKRARDYYTYYFEAEESESRLSSASELGEAANIHSHKLELLSRPSCINYMCSTIISDGNSNYELSWEDLNIGEQIGQGSCGTVYYGKWYRSQDVAIKVFSAQEFSDDLILSFKQEVSFMKRLRHPNILTFIGSLTSPERLCIISEFLHRGSLFRILHRSKSKLDWRQRVHMALDIARGMNYLHRCIPPIVHHNLKSSNVLVDKNWRVKVGDFGLSPLKHQAFLTTKAGKGMPQWMAPEIMRAEPSNEKSDIYSLGVILWELITRKIPWNNLNPMQVVGAVGFMGKQLEIPEDTDLQWAAIIRSCWRSDPELRPNSDELLERLEDVNRQFLHRQ